MDVGVAVVIAKQEKLQIKIEPNKIGKVGDTAIRMTASIPRGSLEGFDFSKLAISPDTNEGIEIINPADDDVTIIEIVGQLLRAEHRKVTSTLLSARAIRIALAEIDRIAESERPLSSRAIFVREIIHQAFAKISPDDPDMQGYLT